MTRLFALLTTSLLSFVGATITTISALIFLTLFVLDLVGMEASPYIGILAFVIIPAIFVLGLLLIPLGLWRLRRKEARLAAQGAPSPRAPVIDLNKPETRAVVFGIGVLTCVNLIIISAATYKGVEVMDSTEFCGGACHSVMAPEAVTHQRSPHSRVECTECHIGSGASWFVKSKLSGSWQLVSVALDLYPRHIRHKRQPSHVFRP